MMYPRHPPGKGHPTWGRRLHPPVEGRALPIVNFIHPSRRKDTPGERPTLKVSNKGLSWYHQRRPRTPRGSGEELVAVPRSPRRGMRTFTLLYRLLLLCHHRCLSISKKERGRLGEISRLGDMRTVRNGFRRAESTPPGKS